MTGLSDALASVPEAVFADLLESDDAYLLVFDLPGVEADGLDLTVRDNRLTIEAIREKTVPDDFWFREEERALYLDADLPLPPDAAGNQATADLDAGVLEVTLPKVSGRETPVPIEG
ncbi:Molecular chaperone (HSP20 family) [Halanaeroarchaeum sp. HSR-CO]|uniref:Hsp20/alpha crystallin family protein n=1 Tax=Halanaeroarchaeum sp. HSR-CO TaxID=2866382 RepID=UPI00217F185C|nr:Hsp20/alpha crystallin family protein [Halanaeroarchaeum sp. HSR-CO]UWG48715.1 Molecular chaperone (HSP20 family) [Halanaeroarchaeum sp. HSR-CO]